MIRQFTALTLLFLATGCTTQVTEQASTQELDGSRNPFWLVPDIYGDSGITENGQVVRYGRYTLVSTLPNADQHDLMVQVLDVNIPANMHPTVGDAMQYVLDRSGYSLCAMDTGQANDLYKRPLPSSHYKLGPMTLRSTLQVLAGPAWQVTVDEVEREVCYVLRQGYQTPQTKL